MLKLWYHLIGTTNYFICQETILAHASLIRFHSRHYQSRQHHMTNCPVSGQPDMWSGMAMMGGILQFSGPFYWHGLTWILAWISNSIPYKVCGEITYPFLNFKDAIVEVKQGKSEGFESCDRPIVRKRTIWVKIGDVLSRVTLKFYGWPWKTIGHLSFAVSSLVQHFIAISEFKLELQSGNAQFGSNWTIFRAA